MKLGHWQLKRLQVRRHADTHTPVDGAYCASLRTAPVVAWTASAAVSSWSGSPFESPSQVWYCAHGGSSAGVRELLKDGATPFAAFKEANPQIEVEVKQRNGHHPVLVGNYEGDRLLPSGQRVPKQLCVKNVSAREVLQRMQELRDQCGGKAKSWNLRQWKKQDSIQGVWTPMTRID